jgi:methionyl-tRNA formyltransferase
VLAAVAERHDVVGVVTQPDRPAGRGHKLVATPVKRAAEARGLRVFTPEKLKPFVDEVRALAADAFVVASYGKILPQALLDVVQVAFNVHPSVLPLYRGATPLQSAIRDGRTETGVTIIAMDAGMDTGDVLLQERTPLGPSETYGELHDRLARRGAELVVEAVEQYANGTLQRKPQSAVAREVGISEEEIAGTLTRPLRKDDLVIDWGRRPTDIVNLVRSLAPQPLARTTCLAEPLKVSQARTVSLVELAGEIGSSTFSYTPGQLNVAGGAHPRLYSVAAAGGDAAVVDRVIAPNRGPMSGEEYARSAMDRFVKRFP